MADYYPLLARALQAMPDRSPALRKAVYDRARGALIGQLRSLEPPLSEADIDLESKALETAIERVENEFGEPPAAAANDVVPPIFVAPEERDTLPEAAAPDRLPEPTKRDFAEPTLPPAPEPNLGIRPSRPDRSRVANADASPPKSLPPAAEQGPVSDGPATVLPIKPRKAKSADRVADRKAARDAAKMTSGAETPSGQSTESESPIEPSIEAPPAERDAAGMPVDSSNARHRPRIDVVAPRKGRPRLLRNVFVGSVLLVVVGLIAVAAFMLRDKPSDLQPGITETQEEGSDPAASKYADRIGGDAPALPERRDQTSRQAPARPTTATPDAGKAPTQPDVAVAQRAVLFEENTAGGNAQPITFQGMVVWRLEAMNGEQGQPLETVIRGRVTFADAGLSLVMTIRRNLDPTFPASHTIELAFTTTSPAGDTHAVQDVGLLSAKDEEGGRGSPVSGLPVRVKENLFLIGLSSLQADVDRNTDLLEHRNWFDLPMKFVSGPRGVLTFEKGTSGNQVIRSAFEQWRR